MNIRKITSLLAAVAIGANTAVFASAEKKESYIVRSVLISNDLNYQTWSVSELSEGSNTITITTPKDNKGNYHTFKGISMLAIDIEDCYFDIGEVKVESIKVNGEPIAFDPDAIVYGADDNADNDNFRIEIFNYLGETKDEPPFDTSSVTVNKNVEITFSFSTEGYSGGTRKLSGNVVENKKGSKKQALSGFSVKAAKYTDRVMPVFNSNISVDYTDDTFSAEVERGYYDVSVSKPGYAERIIRKVPAGKRAPEELKDVELRMFGDINGDGTINVTDISIAAGYVKQVKVFSDEYQSKVADCSHDGRVNVADISAIAGAVKGKKKIK